MNRRWIKHGCLLGLLGSASLFAHAEAVNTLTAKFEPQHQTTLTFSQAPRADLLVQAALQHLQLNMAQIDWNNSALFDVQAPYDLPQHVFAMIEQQRQLNDADQATWQQLSVSLKTYQFAQRIFTPLDPDTTRLYLKDNPVLAGELRLQLNRQPSTVTILGDVVHAGPVAWQERHSALAYIGEDNLRHAHSYVWVIQPDGHAEQHAIAYWNQQFKEVAPGAMIYVPIKTRAVKSSNPTLNQDLTLAIVELLRNRLPL